MIFRAIYLEKGPTGETLASLRDLPESALPPLDPGIVTIAVAWSTMNFKDALAITGRSPVVRRFPMVPGIDFAGTVVASRSALWQPGDEVVLNGWGAGEDWWGGLAQQARTKGEWLIRKPATLTPYETMAVGTAGYTAALCVAAIERHGVVPSHGDVIVTGATGGVGSIAILLLAARGYRVVASTGKLRDTGYLRDLGASDVIDRATVAQPGKPLQKEQWAAAVDTVGSHTLANVCASIQSSGIVTACGLAQGMDLPATEAPFILRGVTLAGINSVMVSMEKRVAAWAMLERLIDHDKLKSLSREIGLSDVIGAAPRFLAGEITGRLVVNVAR